MILALHLYVNDTAIVQNFNHFDKTMVYFKQNVSLKNIILVK